MKRISPDPWSVHFELARRQFIDRITELPISQPMKTKAVSESKKETVLHKVHDIHLRENKVRGISAELSLMRISRLPFIIFCKYLCSH